MQSREEIVEPRRPPRNRVLFNLEDVQRLPVDVTAQAQDFIDASSHNGRLLPQALSEAFAKEEGVSRLRLSLESVPPAIVRLVIEVMRAGKASRYLSIEAAALAYVPPGDAQGRGRGLPGMQAYTAAQALIEQYRRGGK